METWSWEVQQENSAPLTTPLRDSSNIITYLIMKFKFVRYLDCFVSVAGSNPAAATILFWFNLYDSAPALDFTEYLTTGHLHVSAKGGKASDILTNN